MDRFTRAMERARQPSEREWAALFVAGGVALVLYGVSQAAIPPVMPWGIALRSLVMASVFIAVQIPRPRRALVAQVEGCRPRGGDVEVLNWRPAAAMMLAVGSVFPSWWVRPVSWVLLTAVTRSPVYALFLAGAGLLFDSVTYAVLPACMGLGCIADGCIRWVRAGRAQVLEPVNANLAGELLALIDAVGPVDARWLELSSGLDTPERVADCLREIRGRGLLTETNAGVCEVNRDAQRPDHDSPSA